MSGRWRRAERSEAGFSLIELVVSMAVGGVLLLAMGTTFTTSLRTSATTSTRVANTAEMRSAIDVVARRLRLAVRPRAATPAFEVAGPRRVRFYANLLKPGDPAEQAPTLVEYTVTPTCLQETRTTPTGTSSVDWSWSPGAATSTTCLTRAAVGADGGALFTYFASADSAAPLVSGVDVGAAALDLITSVRTELTVKASGTHAVPATTARTRVTLVNLLPAS